MTKTLFVRPEHKDTNKKTRKFDARPGLYTGVSAVALMLGATGGSAVADPGITVTKPTNSVVIGTKQTPDFLDIEAPVTNNVINNGSIGPGDSPTLTVDGPNGGSVGGNIINNNLITGTMAGIFVSSTAKNTNVVGGGIFNFGTIQANGATKAPSSAFGIVVSGPAVVTSVSNTGFIGAGLFATGTGHTAGGVKISSTGSLSSSVTNSGGISGVGTALPALITGDAQMLAFGVAQTNTSAATGPATSNTLTNAPGGGISAMALAFASGTGAATATGIGVGQIGFGTSAAANVMSVSNATSALILGFASAFAVNSTATAEAIGVGQSATGGLSITQNVNNSGVINATANASVSATAGGFNTANATATGIAQTASGSPNITQTITNSGVVNVKASASAGAVTTGLFVNANASSATALGLGQFAAGGTGTISNTLSIVNSSQGSINVTASALGAGSTSPDGRAFATGVSQNSSGGGSHSLTFTNQGALNVLADASAFGTTSATALAQANAVSQTVAATSGATSISLGITNSAFANGTTTFTGSINVTASANATGPFANASASAANQPVFYQSIGGAPVGSSATINLTNQGIIDANYSASATGSNANADVNRLSGWWQDLNGSADTAIATVSNATGAVFSLNGTAFASGSGFSVTATASVVGGWQTINGGLSAAANFSNNGTLNVAANATALGQSPRANGHIDTAIYQSVRASGGAGSTATANINNTSNLSARFNAVANATGSAGAQAVADFDNGFFQTIENADTGSAVIDNSGLIELGADANARITKSGTGNATATANFNGNAFFQSVQVGSNATVVLDNSGTLNLTADAFASAVNRASAFANFGTVFSQWATAGTTTSATASVLFDNSGTVSLDAGAFATGTKARAIASAGDFVAQNATASGSGASANATFSNTSFLSINIDIDATAIATNNNATATASQDDVIFQSVTAMGTSAAAVASATNAGAIDVDVNAFASGTKANANARIDDDIVDQFASATGTGSSATARFTNSGIFTVDVGARAIATSKANALATVSDNGFEQQAFAAGSSAVAVASISNAGTFSVGLSAFASGSKANATANFGSQSTTGNVGLVGQTAGGVLSATANFTNNGTFNLDIDARAIASSNSADANAFMTNTSVQVHGFSQNASAASGTGTTATVNFTNNNTISFDLDAIATGTKANASAQIDGDLYDADASGAETAVINFTNAGTFTASLSGNALNNGGGTSQTADVDLDFQDEVFNFDATASGGAASVATINFLNSGTIGLSLDGNATGSKADVEAEFSTNIFEAGASGANTATVNFTNTNTISASIDVFATASTRWASADGTFSDEIFDLTASTSGGVGTATVNFNNTGTILIAGDASAIGVTFAQASLTITSEVVDIEVNGFNANANFTNDGDFTVDLAAFASAGSTGGATARATMDAFISMDATGNGAAGDSATATFSNTSLLSLDVMLDASAIGTTDASATVQVTKEMFDIQASNAETAMATFDNSGALNVLLNAFASAPSGSASADASLTSDGFQIGAFTTGGIGTATALFNNSGVLSFNINASAIGSTKAQASAKATKEFIDISSNGATANSIFNNDGTISLGLTAFASANVEDATAFVSLDNFVDMAANGNGIAGSTATSTFTNTSLLSIDIMLDASALGVTEADATASLTKEIVRQTASGAETAMVDFNNSGGINVDINAFASAVGNGTTGSGSAFAYLSQGFDFSATASAGDQLLASNSFTNSGVIDINLFASAVGTTKAFARASISNTVIWQSAESGDTSTNTINNSGTLNVATIARASGARNVDAYAYQNQALDPNTFYQVADAGDDNVLASNTLINSAGGSVNLIADASAVGSPSATSVYASAAFFQVIIEQSATDALNVSNLIQNDGSFNVLANAFASNPAGFAGAYVELESGIVRQTASGLSGTAANGGSSTVTLNNTADLSLDYVGKAVALGGTDAHATALIEATYIYQRAGENETATVELTNDGSMLAKLNAIALASGNGTTGHAFATAFIENGIYQFATATEGGQLASSVTLHNRGSLVMDVGARATGTTAATANAWIGTAVWQYAEGGADTSVLFYNNTGSVDFMANAHANGGTHAQAFASVDRVWQTVNPTTTQASVVAEFTNINSASFMVEANATALNSGGGASATATATALGVSQRNTGSGTQPNYTNRFFNGREPAFTEEPESVFSVKAFASAAGGTATNAANAYAEGYRIWSDTNSHSNLNVTNDGIFEVFATALGTSANASALGMVLSAGEFSGGINNQSDINVKASAPSGSAFALGVQMNSAINNSVFTNTGNISVLAIGSTTAIAVQYNFLGGHTISATKADHATFINDGGHVTAQVNSGGTLDFGTAFDLSNAPNPVTLDFQGSTEQGTIWGNILLSDDDNIFVHNGKTYYAGMINGTATFNGFLTIGGSTGTLTLASTATGPAVGYFDTYTNNSTGTLAFNVTPSTPSTGLGQINAVTVNLAGNVQLNIAPGLYADSQTYQDVVTFSTKNGTFDNAVTNSNTPLLSVQDIYPGDGTVDLALTRTAFNLVPGLTINQMGAGSGIEGAYSTGLTGAFGSMVSSLFTLSTNAYIGALEQLHGAEHVQNLRTNLWSMDLLNYALSERINAGTFSNDRAHDRDSVIRSGDFVTWGSYQGMFGDLEGDVEASGYDQRQNAFYGGFDYALSDDFLIGFAAGLYRNRLDFTNGSRKKDEGVQLAVYGAWDTQTYYLRANAALAYYNVESWRTIDLPTVSGTAMGRYDVSVFSFHAEGGRRFELNENVFFTPFIGFTYARAKNDPFSETGTPGANLFLPENSVKSFSGDFGARLAAAYETGSKSIIVPEISFRYRHEFKDEILSINHAFDGVSGSGFSVISSFVDSSMFIAQGGVSFSQGDRVEVKLMYTGRFNSQIEDHGIGIRLSVLWGGR